MAIEVILSRPTATRTMLESQNGVEFRNWLAEWRERVQASLKRGSELAELHRDQGRLDVLERILGLDDEIKNYQRAKLTGRVNPVQQPVGGRSGVV